MNPKLFYFANMSDWGLPENFGLGLRIQQPVNQTPAHGHLLSQPNLGQCFCQS